MQLSRISRGYRSKFDIDRGQFCPAAFDLRTINFKLFSRRLDSGKLLLSVASFIDFLKQSCPFFFQILQLCRVRRKRAGEIVFQILPIAAVQALLREYRAKAVLYFSMELFVACNLCFQPGELCCDLMLTCMEKGQFMCDCRCLFEFQDFCLSG